MGQRKKLLLCFDAFGTLFTPRESIARQYGEVARKHGISGFTNESLQDAFTTALREESKLRPNYGKEAGLNAEHWWTNVITKAFTPFLSHNQLLPDRLFSELLTRFSTADGYRIYPDVLPFFSHLRSSYRSTKGSSSPLWPWEQTVVGIITNSDDRVPGVLTSLGLSVGPRRVGSAVERRTKKHTQDDISFVVLSYDVGVEKPDRKIFQAAEQLLSESLGTRDENVDGFEKVLVGDDEQKDAVAAVAAGWNGVLLSRNAGEKYTDARIAEPIQDAKRGIDVITDLRELQLWKPKDTAF